MVGTWINQRSKIYGIYDFLLKTAPRCRLQGGKIKLQSKLMFNSKKGVCEKQLKKIVKYSIYNSAFFE